MRRNGLYEGRSLKPRTFLAAIASLALAQIAPATIQAQAPQQEKQTAEDSGSLQKATQNPVSGLISVPIQSNSNFGIGPFDRNQNVINIQPVIPISLNHSWNMIIRWVAPIVWQPAPGTTNLEVFGIEENTPAFLAAQDVQAHAGIFGFGDMAPTFFLTPAKSHKMIWGAGPMFVLPTATGRVLGQGKFSAGPSVVAVVQPGHWTFGALVNNVWSIAGQSARADVNQMTFQYFVNYNLKKGWYVSVSPIINANWKATSGNVWTVPVGGGVGRVLRMGFQPVNVSAAFYGNVVHPSGGSPWGMRLQIAFLFPERPKTPKRD
jgi:hypothetical protein